MRILVTGGLGVIGSHLTGHLKSLGHEVVTADLAIRDYSDYVRADVTSFEDLHRIGQKYEIDAVVHMAGEVGRMVGENHPQRMVHVNDVGTLNVIQFCIENDAKLVYFSTSEVYGNLLDSGEPISESAMTEEASVFCTTNIYALSKLFGEALVRHYVVNYALDAVSVRPFMVYGPGEAPSKWRSAMTNFVHAARQGETLKVHEGSMRAWCHVQDFVRAIGTLVSLPKSTTYEVFNVGSKDYRPMTEVAQMIVDRAGKSGAKVEIVAPPMNFLSLRKQADLSKLSELGFSTEISLENGIDSIAEWQESNGY